MQGRSKAEVAAFIETPLPLPAGATMTELYMAALAVDVVGDDLRVRAATGDEVTDLLTTGGYEPEGGIDWPGDLALSAPTKIE